MIKQSTLKHIYIYIYIYIFQIDVSVSSEGMYYMRIGEPSREKRYAAFIKRLYLVEAVSYRALTVNRPYTKRGRCIYNNMETMSTLLLYFSVHVNTHHTHIQMYVRNLSSVLFKETNFNKPMCIYSIL